MVSEDLEPSLALREISTTPFESSSSELTLIVCPKMLASTRLRLILDNISTVTPETGTTLTVVVGVREIVSET